MEDRVRFRWYLLFVCIISFILTLIGLATAFMEAFLVFFSICAYAYIMLFWNESKK
jgi:uncharacterized membrane protein YphA (DoxX/SURF4 family)